MPHSGLGVVECRSADSRPGSLVGYYGQLAEQAWDEPHSYSAAIVGSEKALKPALAQLAADCDVRCICIAGHGRRNHIEFADGSSADEGTLAFAYPPDAASVRGLHLSSCSTVTPELANRLLASNRALRWVSGYRKDANWLQSLAADYCFLGSFLCLPLVRFRLDSARTACNALRQSIGGLVDELGLAVFVRDEGDRVVDLLRVPK